MPEGKGETKEICELLCTDSRSCWDLKGWGAPKTKGAHARAVVGAKATGKVAELDTAQKSNHP